MDLSVFQWLLLPLRIQTWALAIPLLVWAWFFGAVVGSFLNVVIHRLPQEGLSVVRPRSRCPQCSTMIPWYDNIPCFSYLWLRGRCRFCETSISLRYPAVEFFVGLVLAYFVWHFGFSLQTLELFSFSCVLVCVALIDFDTWLIPNVLSLGLVPFGLAFAWVSEQSALIPLSLFGFPPLFEERLVGSVVGFLLLASLLVVSTYIMRQSGRLEKDELAMGWGDPFFLCGIGSFVGWHALPLIVFLASVQGVVIGYWFLKSGKINQEPTGNDDWTPPTTGVPFGPFLALGALESIVFFPGEGLHVFAPLMELLGLG
ncbi:MAG: prepilin peptidase [Myxococcales bacterium]|nr:prepilin peptidase [Myxococcales bacterium]|tara:strand:- start:1632 stop:2573 length:942 start_codon:yes stop_codon:yes gene_type:complete